MLKKTITYKNFDDEEVQEDFYFNLTQAEIVELELSTEGGLEAALKRMTAEQDGVAVIQIFKRILKKAYGKRTPDGKRFIKNDEDFKEFESSEPYSVLFMELVTNADAASEFINGIVPKNMADANQDQLPGITPNTLRQMIDDVEVDAKPAPKVLTKVELHEMNLDEVKSGLADGRYVLGE